MKAPQIIYLILNAIGLLLVAHDHGKPRSDENFWRALLSGAIGFSLLYWGGFFN